MNHRKKIVVLSGAGISAESGIRTFRGADGLWEDYSIEKVATPEGWAADPQKVLDFYNARRRQLYAVEPNAGHRALAGIKAYHRVRIITQNIDNLHERAGSSEVLHLHGELDVARSSRVPQLTYPLGGKDIHIGDTCELGSGMTAPPDLTHPSDGGRPGEGGCPQPPRDGNTVAQTKEPAATPEFHKPRKLSDESKTVARRLYPTTGKQDA